tara:strand:- start:517 stop:1014 length:498 start_codon:yes stop_codon:yes gene_type:complete
MGLTLENFLPYRLARLSEALSAEIQPVYKDAFGLNRPEWRVLAALADIGPATATALGHHSAQHKTKVSRAVRALELRRWIRRDEVQSDRRSEIISMTDLGQRSYCELVNPLREREAQLLKRLGPEDREVLDHALRALEEAVGVATHAPVNVPGTPEPVSAPSHRA